MKTSAKRKKEMPATDIYCQNSCKTEQQQQEQCSAIHYYHGFHGILCMIWANNLKYETNYWNLFHEYEHFMHWKHEGKRKQNVSLLKICVEETICQQRENRMARVGVSSERMYSSIQSLWRIKQFGCREFLHERIHMLH